MTSNIEDFLGKRVWVVFSDLSVSERVVKQIYPCRWSEIGSVRFVLVGDENSTDHDQSMPYYCIFDHQPGSIEIAEVNLMRVEIEFRKAKNSFTVYKEQLDFCREMVDEAIEDLRKAYHGK